MKAALCTIVVTAAALSVLAPAPHAHHGGTAAYGHGVGSETFPPVDLDGRQVTLEVSSSSSRDGDPVAGGGGGDDDDAPLQISISLIDFDSKITLRDVVFLIESERGQTPLFEREFRADHGFLVFNFVSDDGAGAGAGGVVLEERETGGDWLGSLLGIGSRMIDVRGPGLSGGGLYKFNVTVLAAGGYSNTLAEPLTYNAGISIPQTTRHDFVDPNFGNQNIRVITYYDEISGFSYDPGTREISYFMPFEWSETNINQTLVVHTEIVIPGTFGDLLVPGFAIDVNGVGLPGDVVNIDDFFADSRTAHFVIYQKELYDVLEGGGGGGAQDGMAFVIRPDGDHARMSSVTENGQFRILVSWEPGNLMPGSDARVAFDIVDTFLRGKPMAVPYEFSVTQGDRVVYAQSGTSSGSRDERTVAGFAIPVDLSGIVRLNFENLDNNGLARTSLPVVVDRAGAVSDGGGGPAIPPWIRNNAGWWASGQIDDGTFMRGIEFLVSSGIIDVSRDAQRSSSSSNNNSRTAPRNRQSRPGSATTPAGGRRGRSTTGLSCWASSFWSAAGSCASDPPRGIRAGQAPGPKKKWHGRRTDAAPSRPAGGSPAGMSSLEDTI